MKNPLGLGRIVAMTAPFVGFNAAARETRRARCK
jgi:hypothetical protein